ncbi:GPI-anchored protein LORELEI [Brassica napus]|nr:GPI-anchored protein LORELEI [Brassica napus]
MFFVFPLFGFTITHFLKSSSLVLTFCFMEVKLFFLLIALLVTLSSSNSTSNIVFESRTSVSGRSLLSAKKQCEVDFQSKNYTDLTRQCRGPTYPATECCAAFKQFACPYAHQINDLNTDCAKVMFSYITVHGNYPLGLFASECKETKVGLVCPSSPRVSAAPHHTTLVVSAATAVLAFLVFWFNNEK